MEVGRLAERFRSSSVAVVHSDGLWVTTGAPVACRTALLIIMAGPLPILAWPCEYGQRAVRTHMHMRIATGGRGRCSTGQSDPCKGNEAPVAPVDARSLRDVDTPPLRLLVIQPDKRMGEQQRVNR